LERRNFRKVIRTVLELLTLVAVLLKCAVVDPHGALRNINSAALEVACPPPGHGENQDISMPKFVEHTCSVASFEVKLEV
jgi:hypothetical protein